jgi:hypothetical protein
VLQVRGNRVVVRQARHHPVTEASDALITPVLWLTSFRDDPKAIFAAAGKAQRAADGMQFRQERDASLGRAGVVSPPPYTSPSLSRA